MNKHIKTINGKKYYYRSVRKGDKVTSEYIGPVERQRKKKTPKEVSDETLPEAEQKEDYIG